MRRIRLGASVVVLVASIVNLVTAAPAQADYGRPIRSGLNPSRLCLDVRGGIGAAGQDVQIWDCNGGANQRWSF
ncbi:RICIN domain-containing protein [Streptomyces sp. NPDC049585]|uniref:RICIN domain-containing protein n=1 Tax=Streptomyces sp. NPDC049585 TaxID=3155154 RepID=UPI003417C3E5